MRIFTLCLACVLLLAANAGATVIFEDNFDATTAPGLNQFTFDNWMVADGSVDVIGEGTNYDFFPSLDGFYVDLDGSTRDSGVFSTSTPLTFTPGNLYTVAFDLAGSQRGSAESVRVDLGVIIDAVVYERASSDPFATEIIEFSLDVATVANLTFEGLSNDNVGILLDNVVITCAPIEPGVLVPAPACLLLLASGLLGLAAIRK